MQLNIFHQYRKLNSTQKLLLISRLLVLIIWFARMISLGMIYKNNSISELTGLPYQFSNILIWNSLPFIVLLASTFRPRPYPIAAATLFCFICAITIFYIFVYSYIGITALKDFIIGVDIPDYSNPDYWMIYYGDSSLYLILLIPFTIIYLFCYWLFKKLSADS